MDFLQKFYTLLSGIVVNLIGISLFRTLTQPFVKLFLLKLLCAFIGIVLFVIAATVVMPVCAVYRLAVYVLVKKEKGSLFGGLIGGADVVWCLEKPQARSLITVLLMIEMSQNCQDYDNLFQLMLTIAEKTLLSPQSQFPKLAYLRESKLGYYYWHALPNARVEDFIRPIVVDGVTKMTEDNLKQFMQENCNKPLPFNDTATWEMLVGQEPLENTDPYQLPVIVRIHHSVGDGVALIRLLLEALADCKTFTIPRAYQMRSSTPLNLNDVCRKRVISRLSEKIILEAFTWQHFIVNITITVIVSAICIKRSLQHLLDIAPPALSWYIQFLYRTPYMFFNQAFGITRDDVLYGKPLSGDKALSWIIENENIDTNDCILHKIRIIRSRYDYNVKFTDVLLTCLARSLQRFYSLRRRSPPSNINVVIPARLNSEDLNIGRTSAIIQTQWMRARITRLQESRRVIKPQFNSEAISPQSTEKRSTIENERRSRLVKQVNEALTNSGINDFARLENKFSVAILNLPLSTGHSDFDENLVLVRQENKRLQNAPDYLVNYWLLRYIPQFLPVPVLRLFLSNASCSLVLSNIPGPQDPISICSNRVRSIAFWVPNRGLNGVGIGVLSYCGRFSLGLVADKALISAKECGFILNGIIEEINYVYNRWGK